MFYQSLVLFCAAVCREGSMKHKDERQLDKLVKKAQWLGRSLGSLEAVEEGCILNKMETILDNTDHHLHNYLTEQRSSCSGPSSFIPTAIKIFNTFCRI